MIQGTVQRVERVSHDARQQGKAQSKPQAQTPGDENKEGRAEQQVGEQVQTVRVQGERRGGTPPLPEHAYPVYVQTAARQPVVGVGQVFDG